MNRVLKWIFDIIFIIIIGVLLSYFVLRITNKAEIYNVKTGSMEDKIHAGDYILIYSKDNYNVGDVVTFKKDDGFITHRIIKIEGDKITTMGDANNIVDDEFDKSNIVGKVIIAGGFLNIIIVYKYAIVGLLLFIYLLSMYFDNKKDNKEEIIDEKIDETNIVKQEINGKTKKKTIKKTKEKDN